MRILVKIQSTMKRILIIATAMLLAVSCGQTKSQKILVLYYSQTGTTQYVAENIAECLGADIETIVPVVPYDGDYGATIERGRKELDEGNFPELKPLVSDIKDYDIVFLGYPVWFGTYAPPIQTLLNTVDFSGRKVVPFCTFGSGGLDSSSKAIAEQLEETEVLPGYGVRAARKDAARVEIERFLTGMGLLEGECAALEDFSAVRPVTPEESAIFDAAVGTYPMINAKAEEVSCRPVPGGHEYIFTARDLPRDPGFTGQMPTIKVYVLAEDGKEPVFTQVCRT